MTISETRSKLYSDELDLYTDDNNNSNINNNTALSRPHGVMRRPGRTPSFILR
ncbi:hypothetical protein IMZ48_26680 [Candidatus Bathyarchaeota archaeon]|nr:hypothetical protein [Candidatus Bathyarchaeota archaeon]